MRTSVDVRAMALAAALGAGGCLPYTVGSTAHTVPAGERVRTGIIYFIPSAVNRPGDTIATPIRGADGEMRWGLDERSDVGLRVPAASGLVVNYKRVLGSGRRDRAAVAIMPGAGIVNLGEHAHFELTLLASGPDRARVAPYGGLRAMQVAPIASGAVHDTPTLGGFLGLRIGQQENGFSPEIAIYHDRSALGLRRQSWIIVPAISMHGDEAIRTIGELFGRR